MLPASRGILESINATDRVVKMEYQNCLKLRITFKKVAEKRI